VRAARFALIRANTPDWSGRGHESSESIVAESNDRGLLVRAEHLAEIDEYRRRTDQNLAEITDKLNGLIGYVAGHRPDGDLKQ
jgi:hypothetical protein